MVLIIHFEWICVYQKKGEKMTLSNSKTIENLKAAFSGESQANRRYLYFASKAEHIIVTADSVNMVGEACTSGAPVQVFELAGGNRKFRTFHSDMQGAGLTRPFVGELDARMSTPANATPEIAAALQTAWDAKRASFVLKKAKTTE